MIKAKRKLGYFGERMAGHFLQAKGLKVIGQNFSVAGGEIDLICEEGEEIVFVEVKTRTSKNFGELPDSLSDYKLRKLVYTAELYLRKNNLEDTNWRLDFVGIELNGDQYQIEHINDVFY